jgi:ubiquinone/menaquinone biosynthesis C-methylase UbiE
MPATSYGANMVTKHSDIRVPQGGFNAFQDKISPISLIVEQPKIRTYLYNSLRWQFRQLNLPSDKISLVVETCLNEATATKNLLEYERNTHQKLIESGILPAFINLTSNRARIMFETVRPYIVGKSILDLGCGTGKVSELLAKEGYAVHLADVYKNDYVEEHLSNLSFSFIDQDAPLPFADGMFDNVLIFAMLHHSQSPLNVLRETKRILSNRGRLHLIETIFGVEGLEAPSQGKLMEEFVSLSFDEQRQATMFLDYFGNHITWYYTDDPLKFVPVPFNFNTPKNWAEIFGAEGFKVVSKKHIGLDQNSGVYHMQFELEKR